MHKCAPVKFVEGANSTAGPSCMNGTAFTAEWTSATGTTDEDTNTTSSSATPEASAATSTPASAGAALKTGVGSVLSFVLLAAGLALY